LCWPEGNCRFLPALRARRFGFGAHLCGIPAATPTTFSALGFAALAPLWFILETFVGEKHLLASCKNKLGTAFRTLQNPIVEFHVSAPPENPLGQGEGAVFYLGPGCKWTCASGMPGTDPMGLAIEELNYLYPNDSA
jgi:hypothetical protein